MQKILKLLMNISQKLMKVAELLKLTAKIKLASYELEDGTTLEAKDDTGETSSPDGTYKTKDGETIEVKDGIAAIVETPAEDAKEDVKAEDTPPAAADSGATAQEQIDQLSAAVDSLTKLVEELQAQLGQSSTDNTQLQTEKAELSAQVQKLSAEPSDKKIVLKSESKPLTKAQSHLQSRLSETK